MRKSEGFQFVTSKIALSLKPPINKESLRFLPKLRKKLVTAKRFGKINAFRPKIKAIKGKNEELQIEGESKLGRNAEKLILLEEMDPYHESLFLESVHYDRE